RRPRPDAVEDRRLLRGRSRHRGRRPDEADRARDDHRARRGHRHDRRRHVPAALLDPEQDRLRKATATNRDPRSSAGGVLPPPALSRPAPGSMSNLSCQLRWYIAIRLVAVVAAVVPYALFQIGPGSPEPGEIGPVPWHTVFYLLGLTCGETLVYIALLRILRGRPKLQAYIQFGGDLVLINVIVYFYGGIESPFSLLYLIVIAVASTLLRRRAGITVASAANVLYGGLILLAYTGRIHPPGPLAALVPVGWVVYNLAIHCFGFYAVALLISFLAREAQRELEEKSDDLVDLQVMHSDVIQSINSGLITTDLTGVITLVNQAGLAILDKPESELVGRKIQDSGLFSARQWGE